ncbi:MAG: hypothetical protein K0S68_1126 [Candidatus Saccharibacteria bacterium]|nr:hypothetical protein [Candidatus Saccharibacteria bacterium]
MNPPKINLHEFLLRKGICLYAKSLSGHLVSWTGIFAAFDGLSE